MWFQEQKRCTLALGYIIYLLVSHCPCWDCQFSDNEVTEGFVCVCEGERESLWRAVFGWCYLKYLDLISIIVLYMTKTFHSRTSSTQSTKVETTNPPPSLPIGDHHCCSAIWRPEFHAFVLSPLYWWKFIGFKLVLWTSASDFLNTKISIWMFLNMSLVPAVVPELLLDISIYLLLFPVGGFNIAYSHCTLWVKVNVNSYSQPILLLQCDVWLK